MSIQHEILIEQKVSNNKKSTGVAYLLLIFFGGLGAHRFYLNQTLSAITILLSTIFSFAFLPLLAIPVIWCFLDLFLIPSMVNKYKEKLRQDARLEVLGLDKNGPFE